MYKNFDVDQKGYDRVRKEVCDSKGVHMPNHATTVIICFLEELLCEINKIKKATCPNDEPAGLSIDNTQNTSSSAAISQQGSLNINTGAISSDATTDTKTIVGEITGKNKKK